MAAGVQGSVPEADGRPVMGRALAPSLLRPGDQYPAGPIAGMTAPLSAGPGRTVIQAPRPPDPKVGVHSTEYRADVPWPVPLQGTGYHDYEGPIPEGSERYPAVHKTEPLVAPADQWKELWWRPIPYGQIWGQTYPRAVPAPVTDLPPPATGAKYNIPHSLFATMHPTGQQLETRVCYGGHVVIRRVTTPTGLPGQSPYYQAPNTLRSGQPPRWDQGVLLNVFTSGLT